jgi:hypothetical protein
MLENSSKQGGSGGSGGLDRVMKAMVMPREEIQKLLTAKNFNRILDAMAIYEMRFHFI